MSDAMQEESLEKKLQEAQQKANENWDKLLRATAELENAKRRAEKDISNAHRYALERFVEALLPIIDSLEQAIENYNKDQDASSMKEGLVLTLKMLNETLARFGVQSLNPIDQTFNPQLHEAMSMQEAADKPNNTVIQVLQKGYQLNDRIVRPARVIVSKTPS